MELKVIIGIALVAFIVGGFIFCRSVTERKSKNFYEGRSLNTSPLFLYLGGLDEKT